MARKPNERYLVFNGEEYEDRVPIAVTYSYQQAKDIIDGHNLGRPDHYKRATYEDDIEEIQYFDKGRVVK
jgi:hypothetical protein